MMLLNKKSYFIIAKHHRYISFAEKYLRLDMDEQREALSSLHSEILGK